MWEVEINSKKNIGYKTHSSRYIRSFQYEESKRSMKLEIAILTRILIVLVFIATEVNSIKCYQCNSVYDQDCRSLKSDRVHKLIMDCDKFQRKNLTATFCRSVYQKCKFWDLTFWNDSCTTAKSSKMPAN